MKELITMGVLVSSLFAVTLSAQEKCSVDDLEDFYGQELDEEYKIRTVANTIAAGLYQGPLMREADAEGLAALRAVLSSGRDIDIQNLQRVVQNHLYGDSDEFKSLMKKMSSEDSDREAATRIRDREAATRIRDSVYRTFGYRADDARDEAFDTCLIESGQAHLVVTKVLVEYMEHRGLD